MPNELVVQNASPTPVTLIELAINKGVDFTQLKELMDLQERWEKKEAKKEFLSAMSNFQTIVPGIKKTKTAKINSPKGFFQYKYSDLGTISQCIKKALNKCGLSYRWEFSEENNKIKCTCFVSHSGGHTETTSMEAGKDDSGAKNQIQQTGSTQTYLQRYTLIGALGLSTAEDDTDAKGSDLTEEDIMQQWKDSISQVKTQIQLQHLYLKNKKTIDRDERIQKLMKDREAQLKVTGVNNSKVVMP